MALRRWFVHCLKGNFSNSRQGACVLSVRSCISAPGACSCCGFSCFSCSGGQGWVEPSLGHRNDCLDSARCTWPPFPGPHCRCLLATGFDPSVCLQDDGKCTRHLRPEAPAQHSCCRHSSNPLTALRSLLPAPTCIRLQDDGECTRHLRPDAPALRSRCRRRSDLPPAAAVRRTTACHELRALL